MENEMNMNVNEETTPATEQETKKKGFWEKITPETKTTIGVVAATGVGVAILAKKAKQPFKAWNEGRKARKTATKEAKELYKANMAAAKQLGKDTAASVLSASKGGATTKPVSEPVKEAPLEHVEGEVIPPEK